MSADAVSPVINTAALEPLFAPWEEPDKHRVRGGDGETPGIADYRRPSPIRSVNALRAEVRQWREVHYVGASETTRTLLDHWFARPHRMDEPSGGSVEFRYYFCQREAIETFIYLMEARSLRSLSSLIAEFGGDRRRDGSAGNRTGRG